MYTHIGDAVRQGVKTLTKQDVAPVSRWRLSSLFGPDGRILPYSFTTALGAHTLHIMNITKIPTLGMEGESLEDNGKYRLKRNSFFFKRKYGSTPFRVSNYNVAVAGKRGSNRPLSGRPSARGSFTAEGFLGKGGDRSRSLFPGGQSRGGGLFGNSPADDIQSPQGDDAFLDIDSMNGSEFVIHTSMIRQDVGTDRLVILSNKRLVIADYKRSVAGAVLLKRWETDLNDLEDTELEKTGGKASLTIHSVKRNGRDKSTIKRRQTMYANDTIAHKMADTESSIITIFVEYQLEDTLRILHNCINTLLHRPEKVQDLEKETLEFTEEADEEVFHIGPWVYDLSDDQLREESNQLYKRQKKLIEDLQLEQWMIIDGGGYRAPAGMVHSSSRDRNMPTLVIPPLNTLRPGQGVQHTQSKTVPKWLVEERMAAIQSHNVIEEIVRLFERVFSFAPALSAGAYSYEEHEPSSRTKEDWPGQAHTLTALKDGLLSYEEFKRIEKNATHSEAFEYWRDVTMTDSRDLVGKRSRTMDSEVSDLSHGRKTSQLRERAKNWFKRISVPDDDDSGDGEADGSSIGRKSGGYSPIRTLMGSFRTGDRSPVRGSGIFDSTKHFFGATASTPPPRQPLNFAHYPSSPVSPITPHIPPFSIIDPELTHPSQKSLSDIELASVVTDNQPAAISELQQQQQGGSSSGRGILTARIPSRRPSGKSVTFSSGDDNDDTKNKSTR